MTMADNSRRCPECDKFITAVNCAPDPCPHCGTYMIDDFDSGEVYDCADDETLTHGTPEEAIVDLFANNLGPHDDVRAEIERLAPLTVTAYESRKIPEPWLHSIADRLVEQVDEWIWDEYGGEDSDTVFDDAAVETLTKLARELMNEASNRANVHPVRKVGKRTYTADEIEAILREDGVIEP